MRTPLLSIQLQILLNHNLTENRPTNKGNSLFIKHTSSDFHEVSCKEKTNNSETLAQATQTSALLNHSYVSNDVFDVLYVDYIEFKKYVNDITVWRSKCKHHFVTWHYYFLKITLFVAISS